MVSFYTAGSLLGVTTSAPSERKLPFSIVDSVNVFVSEHGGRANAVLQPVGKAGVRMTLVGADGELGDRMVADLPTAEAVVEVVPGLSRAVGWDRELTTRVTPRDGHWVEMAGRFSKQKRFPKARNER
jgi:hypothetical protein